MKIEIENYKASRSYLPEAGQHIIAHQQDEQIVVYQAYNPSIASFAVANQILGGSAYSYNRMSWIKPNFLWMMYRCGWGEKHNQERVLALWINKSVFEEILANAVLSSYNPKYYLNQEVWKNELATKEVRLQWDPDHDPAGNKLTRRAIQLGLKGKMLEQFGKHQLNLIEDITDFVKEQKLLLDKGHSDQLSVPVERVCNIDNPVLKERTGIEG
ncbi:protein of unknown function [Chitinophaga sp. YR573]|uniref:DUF4291 domain-containing protein n=1 Tax=Chitinophaga sp. YR573 TaxID=1881040 RepID=UPI0008B29C20|nr:DUF4291 domain-containing protein [Chitinophaga sp. YR573]SEW39408.1 protein of unknown function [Chitinophaga sp. YR573]